MASNGLEIGESPPSALLSRSVSQKVERRSTARSFGKRSNARWWNGRYSWSGLGTTYGAERWKTVIEPTSSTIPGTNWIALAPVPTTATRLPVRSTSWRHSAEWKAGPANVSAPGIAGTTGLESWPTAEITTSASYAVPSVSSTRQRPVSSSNRHEATSTPVRTRSSRPSRSAASRR